MWNNLHWTAVIRSIVLGDGGPPTGQRCALIDARANLQLSDRRGNTPLRLARFARLHGHGKMLEAAGAK